MSKRILVWDVPTRVFHWLMVLSFAGTFLTAESERNRDVHVALGYILLGLLVFRLLWGFIGTHYARFDSFLFRPRVLLTYLKSLVKREPDHYVGHNPAGSVAIWLLLLLGAVSSVSGVFVYEDIGGSDELIDGLVEAHDLVSYAMLFVVAGHIFGVLVGSMMHRENLVRSMITGFKFDEQNEGIKQSYLWLGVVMLMTVVAFWFGYTLI